MTATLGKPAGSPSGAVPFGVQAVGAPAAITVGASPFTHVAGANIEYVTVTTPASTTLTVAKRGVTIASVLTPAATTMPVGVILGPGESIVVTYTNLPVMIRDTP